MTSDDKSQPLPQIRLHRASINSTTIKRPGSHTTKPQQPAKTQTKTQPKKPLVSDNQKVQYQPATGFSRLGRDIYTGDYVDVPQASRRQGLYIIGANGTGKTGLIEHLILQDIHQGLGVGLLDPHGDLTNAILAKMTKREEDVILLDIQDEDHPFGLNMFECPNPQSNTAVQKIVDLVMHIFEKLYDVSRQTPRMAQYLRNCTYTLVANPGYTMADIPLLLTDEDCRRHLLANVTDSKVRLFWKTYDSMKPAEQREHAESTLNKLDEFLSPLVINIVGQAQTTVNIQQVMDERKILLVKLSAQLDQVTSLIGSAIIAMVLNAAYARANVPVNKRKQFNLYADEFQRFATEDFATLLTEARKFGIATTIAHQGRYQPGMTDGIRAVSLQAANLVVFRVTSLDADELAGEFQIRPEAAYEQELEAEQLEIREQERLEMMEVIDGEEAAITYKRNVVEHLLHQGHQNPAVETFVRKYLQPLKEGSQNRDVSSIGLVDIVYGSSVEAPSADILNEGFSLFWHWYNADYKNKVTGASVDLALAEMDRREHQWKYDDYGNYSYKPSVVSRDLQMLNDFLYDAMRGNIPDLQTSLLTAGFLHEPGHFGLSAFLGFDTYYYVTYYPLAPQVKEAYFHILDFTRKYYADRDIVELFGTSTLAQERQTLEQRIKQLQEQVDALRPEKPYIEWIYFHYMEREHHTKTYYFYNKQIGNFLYWEEDLLKDYRNYKELAGKYSGFGDFFPTKEDTPWDIIPIWNSSIQGKKQEEQAAWEYTKILCMYSTKPIPGIPRHVQQTIARLMKEWMAISQRLDHLTDRSGTRRRQLKEWYRQEVGPWLPQLQTDTHGYDLHLKAKVYDAEKHRYEQFISSLLATAKALQQDPIRTSESGQYQPRTRQQILMHPEKTFAHPRKAITHPQRTYQDVRNELATQLVSLPNFTARIRITVEEQTVEHTIKTLPPGQGMGKALQQRIAAIQAQNRKPDQFGHVYCRSRQEVEAEITKRQAGWDASPVPQVPQRSQQQPQSRYVRQVPVQGKCPNCGATNQSGARFCNQCGTKL